MKSAKVLVTGAAGFMGSHLVNFLVEAGCKSVYGVDDLSGGYLRNVNPKSYFTKLDLRDQKKTVEYIQRIKPELIFHLAADATEGRSQFTPISCTQRNYLAYLNTLVAGINNGLRKIILTSSMSVYGSQKPPFSEDMPRLPDDIYGISKAAMERSTEILSEIYGFKYIIIRPHNVYGPGQNFSDPYRNVIAIFINCILNGKNYYIYGDGNQKRAFSYIDDFTPYVVKAAFSKQAEGEIFNIGPDQEYTINELSRVILRNFFPKGKIPSRFKPMYISFRPLEVKDAWCTVSKARRALDYKTTVSLEEGVRKTIEWTKSLGPQRFRYLEELEIINDKTPETWIKRLI